MTKSFRIRNKIAGAVYGACVGDALGATTEFMKKSEIKKIYGRVDQMIGGGWLQLEPGDITDDTEMTMCVMDAIMKNPHDLDAFLKELERNFMKWMGSRPKDIGSQCARAIIDMYEGKSRVSMKNQSKQDLNALGNGSLMRAVPLAVMGLPYHNVFQGRTTHNNMVCSNYILWYSRMVQEYLYNDNIYNIIDNIKSLSGLTGDLMEPTGCVINSFNNALYWVENTNTFRDAIIGAVNHGGDADTIASITGGLAGAKYGYQNIPEEWIIPINFDVKKFMKKFLHFVFAYLQV